MNGFESHCSASVGNLGYCFHGFMQNKGCKNAAIKNCVHGAHLDPLPPCLNEDNNAPDFKLVERHRKRLQEKEQNK